MRFILSQELKQEQRQILTQRMIQSMELLQLTFQQLEQRIDQELEQNPVLELGSEPSSDTDERSTETDSGIIDRFDEDSQQIDEREPEIRFETLEDANATEEFSIADEFAQNYADTIDEAPIRSQNWLENQDTLRADIFANVESPGKTLQEHLEQQLNWYTLSEPLREMVLLIINNLDSAGYFPYELGEFLGENHTADELALAQEALALVKGLEPTGVGGKNLEECLLMQIDPESHYADLLRILITACLEDISNKRLQVIAKKYNYPLEVVQGAVAELRHFSPRPGSGFGAMAAAALVPDIIIEKTESGTYTVRLEDGRTPQLRISKYYKSLIEKHGTDQETRAYIRKKVGAARWLLDAIGQRRDTLLRVSQAMVDHQVEFFDKGQHALKPLKMQQIADQVGMHVTTVSRACDEKWVASPQGVFPLRRLFVGGIASVDNEDAVASDVVRLKLQAIIDNEDKKNPFSDDAIVKMLEADGTQVARRTIAKYRQLMDIPDSRSRRHWD
ncbi:MAG: RNA polymerase factor sigma-54 [Planctomycetaceae bacterium]|nr:RNA polymerase factor sigma-54 [Planctomycetaceae bacterium]